MVAVSQRHLMDRAWAVFDDDHVVAYAGLALPALLMSRLGLESAANAVLSSGYRPGRKVCTLVAGMLAGADCIDGIDVLRAGSAGRVLASDVMAPSTCGSWLRSLSIGQVSQLDSLMGSMFERAWQLGARPDAQSVVGIDLDSSVHEVYGDLKQGAQFAYNHVYGLHPQYSTIRATGEVVAARLRAGSANSARGAAGLLAKAVARVRRGGHEGPIEIGADSAFHNSKVIGRCIKLGVRYSITARKDKIVRELIDTIDERKWRSIEYRGGIAQVAESYHGLRAGERLIIRRVKNYDRHGQGSLFDTWQHHAFVTNKEGDTLTLDAEHRKRAMQELAIRDLKAEALAHMPSGDFQANAAWMHLACLAHNLLRWTGRIGLGIDGWLCTKTIRARLLATPGRITRTARRTTLRLPARWPWAEQWLRALRRIRSLPMPC